MSTVVIQLPEDLREFIEAKVQCGEFASVSDYIVALVTTARTMRSEVETALVEGLTSGAPQEWTSDEWDAIRQRVTQRHRTA